MTLLRARVLDLLKAQADGGKPQLSVTQIATTLGVSAIEVIDALDDLQALNLIDQAMRPDKGAHPASRFKQVVTVQTGPYSSAQGALVATHGDLTVVQTGDRQIAGKRISAVAPANSDST